MVSRWTGRSSISIGNSLVPGKVGTSQVLRYSTLSSHLPASHLVLHGRGQLELMEVRGENMGGVMTNRVK